MKFFKDSKQFVDEIGTIYESIDDEFYDYKLTDEFGVDYCTIEQMIEWDVKIEKEIKE